MDEVPRMAERVEARRRELGLAPGAFAERSGLTAPALAHVRAGRKRRYQESTIYGVARALRWRTDWYERLLADQEPEVDDGALPSDGQFDRGVPDHPQLAASGSIDVSDLSNEDRQYVLELVERLRGR
jgi:transcriptional regulator with XRE-family HTH domain